MAEVSEDPMPVVMELRPVKVLVRVVETDSPGSKSPPCSVQPSSVSEPSSRTCHSTQSGTHGCRQVVMATGLGGVPSTIENLPNSLATWVLTCSV